MDAREPLPGGPRPAARAAGAIGGTAQVGPRQGPWVALAETFALAGLLLSYIWGWQGRFRGDGLVIVALYFGIGAAINLRHGEGPRAIGIRLDNLMPALRLALACLAPIAAAALAAGAALRSWTFPPWPSWPLSVTWRGLWGMAQDYGLVCVFYRRLRELLPAGWRPVVAGGLLFGMFHLPNPFLTLVTVIAGALACLVYERRPNLLALGVVHGAISFVLFYSLPVWLTLELRVGPQVLPYLAWPF